MNAIAQNSHSGLPGNLPVAVIGAGPVGLAAAVHLLARGLPVKLYESAAAPAAHVRAWGHVKLFSPWVYNIDRQAQALLEKTGWQAPLPLAYPTGAQLHDLYLKPLADTPELRAVIETDARVVAISRAGHDKMKSAGRETAPFVLAIRKGDGSQREDLARAVIDASGTWSQPSPIGSHGLRVPGEAAHGGRIAYGIPDILGRDIDIYADKRVLVIGAGHSAANVLLDLAQLAGRAPYTKIVWAVRGGSLKRLFGGGENDKLEARGALGRALENLVATGGLDLHMRSTVMRIDAIGAGLAVTLQQPTGAGETIEVDRIIVATGQRPDLDMLRELRLDLDAATESPRALAPLIDPNVHSCGTVRPHGHRELAQPEAGFYLAGIKSYGRAPTFLMATGYEQVRSIAAALAGDMAAADDVQLDLPETGVCSSDLQEDGGCCESAVVGAGCTTVKETVPETGAKACCGTAKPRVKVTGTAMPAEGCC